ncbi:hypothetical protein [Neptuniibacter pectenicola]|uniref:hypothetical protein n=1 Tax=Neptuniibacter pectenicola TaxID=1806669 RepID=UPI00082CB271|nr:hypothetical protein [Neptuniibacter pectenicola]
MNQGKYYYEFNHGVYYLMLLDGEFQEFRSYQDMVSFVDDPASIFVEVTLENWHRLYEEGAFF